MPPGPVKISWKKRTPQQDGPHGKSLLPQDIIAASEEHTGNKVAE
jgi:hypothetical protein